MVINLIIIRFDILLSPSQPITSTFLTPIYDKPIKNNNFERVFRSFFRYCSSTINRQATQRTRASASSSSNRSTTPTGDYWTAPDTRCRQTLRANITSKGLAIRRFGCLSSNTTRPAPIPMRTISATSATRDFGFGTKWCQLILKRYTYLINYGCQL